MASSLDCDITESTYSLTPDTVKRNPKNLDLNKNELLQLLCQVEAELEAREIALAVLKSDKAKQLLHQAKYGHFSLGDPFLSLQRDSDCHKDQSFDEVAVKAMYDNQLVHLENLIATQRKAQQRMREQLISVEKRFHKVCAELEEEKRKHAQDTAQGDDVTYMLEKDREKLKTELEAEKVATKKVEKELKRTKLLLTEQEDISARHKQVAVVLIKERKGLVKKLVEMDQMHQSLEQSLKDSASRSADSQQSAQAEAMLEKQRVEFDMEREQYKARLAREESRNNQLTADIERLSVHIEQLQLQMGMKRLTDNGPTLVIDSTLSPAARGHPMSVPGMRVVTPGSTSALPASSKNTVSPHTPPEMRRMISDPYGMDHGGLGHSHVLSPSPRLSANQEYLLRQAGSDIAAAPWLDPRPAVPAKPVSVDPLATKLLTVVPPPSGAVYHHSSSSSHTSNFITLPPSAVRPGTAPSNNIALVVGMEPSPNQVRRSASVTRGNPPPVPPNKPNIQAVTTASQRLPPGEKPQPPPRFVGISPSKDNRSQKPTDGTDGPQVLVK